jgi:hypothetical protein
MATASTHEQWAVQCPVRHELQQLERRGAGLAQVFEKYYDGAVLRGPFQAASRCLELAEAAGLGSSVLGFSAGFEKVRRRRAQVFDGPNARQLAKRLDPGPEGGRTFLRARTARHYRHPQSSRAPRDLVYGSRLADAGFTRKEKQGTSAIAHITKRFLEVGSEFPLTHIGRLAPRVDRRFRVADLRDEAIPNARCGLDDSLSPAIVIDRSSDGPHRLVDRRLANRQPTPDLLRQLSPGHSPVTVGSQVPEKPGRQRRELHRLACATQFAGARLQ